jgi:hypothetical protein
MALEPRIPSKVLLNLAYLNFDCEYSFKALNSLSLEVKPQRTERNPDLHSKRYSDVQLRGSNELAFPSSFQICSIHSNGTRRMLQFIGLSAGICHFPGARPLIVSWRG